MSQVDRGLADGVSDPASLTRSILPAARPPLVSIGLPVYNAELYLRPALDALVAQDYPNIEIIISDNASNDTTRQICADYSSRFPQIRYHREERNMGAVWNFNRVLELAQGEYFMWAAHDDLRHPRYVEACVSLLEARPDACLCCTEIRFVDEDGADVMVQPSVRGLRPVGATPHQRLVRVAGAQSWYDVYGLIRTKVLRATRRVIPTWGFDVVLTLELCLRGNVLLVPEQLFEYRLLPAKRQEDMAVGLTGAAHAVSVSWSGMAVEMLRAIQLAPLGPAKRLLLGGQLLIVLCFGNLPVAAGIRSDLTNSIRTALAGRRWGRFGSLLMLGVLIYPTQSGAARSMYRLMRQLRAASGQILGPIAKVTGR